MRSIRRALLMPLLIGVPVLLLLAGAASSWFITNELRSDFDRALRDKAVGLAALTQRVGNTTQLDFDFSDELMPEFSRADRPEYFQLWTATGDVVERSRSLANTQLPRLPNVGTKPRTQNYHLPDGRAGRLVELSFVVERDDAAQGGEPTLATGLANEKSRSGDEPLVVIALARGTDQLQRLIEWVFAVYLGSALLLAVAIIVLLRRVLRRGLQPLVNVAAQVAAIDADSLDSRIALAPAIQELAPIVSRINELLGSVGAALDRERQFSANVMLR